MSTGNSRPSMQQQQQSSKPSTPRQPLELVESVISSWPCSRTWHYQTQVTTTDDSTGDVHLVTIWSQPTPSSPIARAAAKSWWVINSRDPSVITLRFEHHHHLVRIPVDQLESFQFVMPYDAEAVLHTVVEGKTATGDWWQTKVAPSAAAATTSAPAVDASAPSTDALASMLEVQRAAI
ncbi:hypothetical protein RI367_006775 [Sorochytrium milnesiophthora]